MNAAAARYLADPVLGSRLRHDVPLMTSHKGKSALELLGSPDDLKFRSCLTLFAEAASDDSDRVLFNRGAADNNKPARNVVRTARLQCVPSDGRRKGPGTGHKIRFPSHLCFHKQPDGAPTTMI
jgi:hypothetical protein